MYLYLWLRCCFWEHQRSFDDFLNPQAHTTPWYLKEVPHIHHHSKPPAQTLFVAVVDFEKLVDSLIEYHKKVDVEGNDHDAVY